VSQDLSPIILAFSGGLDTSFCVPWLRETHGREVITAVLIDCKQDFFSGVIQHLIAGNVLRGQAYPLCVGAERGLQAARLAQLAKERGATTVAHGCTAAGNDQVRFEVALRTLNPGLEILAPVRDNNWVRDEQLAYLEDHGMPPPAQGSAYSINRGLWGITIGGQETLTSEKTLPEDAWVLSPNAFSDPQPATQHSLEFAAGIPVKLDGKAQPPVALIEALEALAGAYGIGRGIHLGDTVLGTKGRVAFEAPAAIALITAHRELEKLVLSAQQMRVKDSIAATYGDLVHEGRQLDLVCADIEAFLNSSQKRVTGVVRFSLKPGNLFIEGVESRHSLLAATKGVYGESAGEWTAADALGYARILSLPGSLQTRARGDAS